MENKFKVGDKVLINLSSQYKHQGVDKEGKQIIGEVFEVTSTLGLCNRVRWIDRNTNSYRDKDLELHSVGEPNYEIY